MKTYEDQKYALWKEKVENLLLTYLKCNILSQDITNKHIQANNNGVISSTNLKSPENVIAQNPASKLFSFVLSFI